LPLPNERNSSSIDLVEEVDKLLEVYFIV